MSHAATAHHHSDDSNVTLGVWIYLMTDLVLFATLFATYAVLRNNTFGGPSAAELFSLPFVLVETMLLLTSSFTSGLAMLFALRGHRTATLGWLLLTGLLGAAFLGMEIYEFRHLIHEGHGPQTSAFLSAFFTLVGTHGLHIFAGLLWLGVLMTKIIKRGLSGGNITELTCFGLFWHFLDIVWIFIFTFIYLMGAIS
jgi:cytochrome o ubiquinol oxidase subunit III